MFKLYRVKAYSEMMNAEMDCTTLDNAFVVYQQLMNSGFYHSGDLVDNNTGELYAYFNVARTDDGVFLETWAAV